MCGSTCFYIFCPAVHVLFYLGSPRRPACPGRARSQAVNSIIVITSALESVFYSSCLHFCAVAGRRFIILLLESCTLFLLLLFLLANACLIPVDDELRWDLVGLLRVIFLKPPFITNPSLLRLAAYAVDRRRHHEKYAHKASWMAGTRSSASSFDASAAE